MNGYIKIDNGEMINSTHFIFATDTKNIVLAEILPSNSLQINRQLEMTTVNISPKIALIIDKIYFLSKDSNHIFGSIDVNNFDVSLRKTFRFQDSFTVNSA